MKRIMFLFVCCGALTAIPTYQVIAQGIPGSEPATPTGGKSQSVAPSNASSQARTQVEHPFDVDDPSTFDSDAYAQLTSAYRSALPPELQDAAFDRYVDLALLQAAEQTLDPVLMTDIALQMAEGERVLLRSHKAGTSDEVFRKAIRYATAKRDKATLDRLAKGLERHGKKEMLAQLETSRKLSLVSRAGEPQVVVSLTQVTPEEVERLKEIVQEVRRWAAEEDRQKLETLAGLAPGIPGLQDRDRQALRRFIDQTLAQLPQGSSSPVRPSPDIFDRLGNASRAPDNDRDLIRRIILLIVYEILKDELANSSTGPVDPNGDPPDPGPIGGSGDSGDNSGYGKIMRHMKMSGAHGAALGSVSGRWQTNFGSITLQQSGSSVNGSISWNDGSFGQARGSYQNGILKLGYLDRQNPRRQGVVLLTFDQRSKSFHGGYKNSATGATGEWTLRR